MDLIIVTQARTGSTRLPNKVLKTINNQSLLEIHLERIKMCKSSHALIVATTTNETDDTINEICSKLNIECFRGSEFDVLDRFFMSVKNYQPKWIVRLTSDCPLIDPVLIDNVIEFVLNSEADYGSNTLEEMYPDGQDIEVFSFESLKKAWKEASLLSEREHVTPYIINNSNFKNKNLFRAVSYPASKNYSRIRMTVDEIEDFEMIKILINDLGTQGDWKTYTEWIIKNNLDKINSGIERNEGLKKSIKNDSK